MNLLIATSSAVALHLLLGAVLFSATAAVPLGTRRPALWRAARELRRAAPVALIVLVLSILVRRPDTRFPVGLALSAAGALSTSGCYLIWRAGRLEYRGARRPSRRLGRLAGWVILAGVAALAVFSASSPAATALLATTGLCAVLAGLSGKPRPAGQAAALLYVAAFALLVR